MTKRKKVDNDNVLGSKKQKSDANPWLDAVEVGDNDLVYKMKNVYKQIQDAKDWGVTFVSLMHNN
ncbi:hypothetical protein N9N97_02900, partial [Rickettsiaceae bacterium]|nr:hypothetical protein [Rickettsiaceae bacterium]